ncbi:MAG: rRNA maturation RNase YbeY [Candidatus Latescibacteria bacterium 4484_181]|nr:MAG: rRNA maturation RNase YbeY [Candidatus Latescibacteria bacterium 4484_181]RKY68816.1 MAG: rRNA maturation RNase YbeY [Candidatus Latescibacterota bacterium]RKY72364.1 MAG: rRNA maturation RNase YbeY [Candidatus Latescibacterota bacterium]
MQILYQRSDERLANLDTEGLCLASERLLHHLGCREEEVNVVFVDDTFIQNLNRKYRQVDLPTDVLCFDLSEPSSEEKAGEIYISLDRAAEQAQQYGVSLRNEVARLVVHGLLHLVGYDDQSDTDREVMKQKTEEYLQQFYADFN